MLPAFAPSRCMSAGSSRASPRPASCGRPSVTLSSTWNPACNLPSRTDNASCARWNVERDHRSGFEALFQGIAGILQLANDIVVRAGDDGIGSVEVRRSASIRTPGTIRARYGASVRVGVPSPVVDVFDEGDHYAVIAELPGIDRSDLEWSVRD